MPWQNNIFEKNCLPSGMSGKHLQMYWAIHTNRKSSCAPPPSEVITEVFLLSFLLDITDHNNHGQVAYIN